MIFIRHILFVKFGDMRIRITCQREDLPGFLAMAAKVNVNLLLFNLLFKAQK